uniref:Large ribosomal subunit protein uL1 n=1 Tax=Candidatus Aschnera chinzeii TaxID=1485666 RepID=A0AAT9G3Y3_9ENTR|nr:MAG: 50S ribosomal protein L1 [Candidatus Aschnera chinzeii]
MSKLTKRMSLITEKIISHKQYNINEAITVLKNLPPAKFIESIDVAINLGIDSRKSDQNIRGFVQLPHGIGRNICVAVLAQGKLADDAYKAGAELVGTEEIIKVIQNKKINFDILISSMAATNLINQVGHILGPRGLMPSIKLGTITNDITYAVQSAKKGRINIRNDKNGIIHTSIGKINFNDNQLKENFDTLLVEIKKMKPFSAKGIFFKKISLSTTMGISIIINQSELFIL